MSWEEGNHGHPGRGICGNKMSVCLCVCVHTSVCIWEYPNLYTSLITVACTAWVSHAPTTRFTRGSAAPGHVGDVSVHRTNHV